MKTHRYPVASTFDDGTGAPSSSVYRAEKPTVIADVEQSPGQGSHTETPASGPLRYPVEMESGNVAGHY